MSDPAPATLSLWAQIIQIVHPWIVGLGIGTSGAFEIKSAAKRTEIEGGGPAVARVDDVAGYQYVQVVAAGGVVSGVILWRSPVSGAGSMWTAVATGPGFPVNGVTTGTPITITTGSEKVTCG